MASDKRVKCPACSGVAFIRANRIGDPFLTCPNCGAWNGRGPKYRAWCESLPSLDQPEPEPISPAAEPEPGPMTADSGDAETQQDWLEQWGRE